ncbi:MAG: GTPase HflX [Oscillospiraceae bacterium]|jgi:GTP-binding protein HflX|nr:GTPase HflX [Oscillospiraceae bacterium]
MQDIKDETPARAALAAVDTGAYDAEESLAELAELARTTGAEVVFTMVQNRGAPDNASYFGQGKLEELKEACEAQEIDLLLCDDELSPAQLRNIEQFLNPDEREAKLKIRVADRTMLILDIFAMRAKSREGKLQVDLAQLKYSLPRLQGQWYGLSRQGGGIGTRGRGETKFETDRRHVKTRIRKLEAQLRELEQQRGLLRERRRKNRAETVAIVGYTNVGKSTLMNALTGAGVLAEDKLFATLDPTARRLTLPDGRNIMLIDTVGLLRRLPHSLVEAFHSTLEEARAADLILNLCDAASPDCQEQLSVTADLLRELGCDEAGIPVLRVLNKCDLAPPDILALPVAGCVRISALTGEGLQGLLLAIANALPNDRTAVRLLLPYELSAWSARLRALGRVDTEEYRENGVYYEAVLPAWLLEECAAAGGELLPDK